MGPRPPYGKSWIGHWSCSIWSLTLFHYCFAVADPGFPVVGCQPLTQALFSGNVCEDERIWSRCMGRWRPRSRQCFVGILISSWWLFSWKRYINQITHPFPCFLLLNVIIYTKIAHFIDIFIDAHFMTRIHGLWEVKWCKMIQSPCIYSSDQWIMIYELYLALKHRDMMMIWLYGCKGWLPKSWSGEK